MQRRPNPAANSARAELWATHAIGQPEMVGFYSDSMFAGLIEAYAAAGLTETRLGLVKQMLWNNLVNGGQTFGSGIAAFPSVHVGMATVTALYFYDRFPISAPLGLAYLLTIQVLSVVSGWHWAIDGYFSILFIWGFWIFLRRRQAATGQPDPTRPAS